APMAAAAAGVVLLSRLGVYPLSELVSRMGGDVPRPWQHVIVWGGLRGALSMALALGLPLSFPYRDTLVAATFGAVLFSLLVQGLTIAPLLRALKLTGGTVGITPELSRLAGEIVASEAALAEIERLRL